MRPYIANRVEEPLGKNLYGRSAILPPATSATSRPTAQLIDWRGQRDEVQSLAINYGMEITANLFGDPVRIQATLLLEWGGEGASFSAELDMIRGGCVVVQGSYIRAIARNDSDVTLNTIELVPVSAGLSFAGATSKASTIHPTRTFFEANLAANSPVLIRIPNFAKTVDFIRNNFLTSSFTAQFRDNTAAGFLGGVNVAAGGQLPRELQIPQGAASLELSDTSGTTVRILTQFGLDL